MSARIRSRLHRMVPLLPALLLFVMTQPLAHEYWLDPVGVDWKVGGELLADIRNGEAMIGTALPFQPDKFSRAGMISDSERLSLSGRLGDYPALRLPLKETGLHLLLLETTRRELRHEDYRAFQTFLESHALQDIGERHRASGMPQQNIIEHYYRYCKTFVFVDASADVSNTSPSSAPHKSPALEAQGQRLELLTSNNPITSDSLRLQLLLEGAALVSRQVELYHLDDQQQITRHTATTDASGIVEFGASLAGDYLVNSVAVLEPEDASAHWTTLWASLFFQKN